MQTVKDYKSVKEFTLQTGSGSQGTLLIPRKILDTLVDEVESIIPPIRTHAAIFVGPGSIPGSSIDINRVLVNSGTVRLQGEGAEIDLSNAEYNTVNIKPDKYGVQIQITKELMEDSQFDLLRHNISHFGKRFAENEMSRLVSQSLDSAANTVAGGAAITLTNISRAIQHLKDSKFRATTMYIGPEVENDMRLIDTLVEADKSGTDAFLRSNTIGRLYNMDIFVVDSTTPTGFTTTSSYVFDRTQAYAFVEKRPLTVERFPLPTRDSTGMVLTQRFRTTPIRTAAIAKITTS